MGLKRRKNYNTLPEAEVNIVSLMDILTTMLFFLVLFVGFANSSVLRGRSMVNTPASGDPKPTFTLKLTLEDNNRMSLWLGPTAELKTGADAQWVSLKGTPQTGFEAKVEGKDTQAMLAQMQNVLAEIKKVYPMETKAVLEVHDQVSYQSMIDAMTATRSLGEATAPISVVNPLGKTESTKVLFPEVILSEAAAAPAGA